MMQTICYAFIYLFEVLACFMFYENFYQRKSKKLICILTYLFSFAVQFGVSFITIPLINLISFH